VGMDGGDRAQGRAKAQNRGGAREGGHAPDKQRRHTFAGANGRAGASLPHGRKGRASSGARSRDDGRAGGQREDGAGATDKGPARAARQTRADVDGRRRRDGRRPRRLGAVGVGRRQREGEC